MKGLKLFFILTLSCSLSWKCQAQVDSVRILPLEFERALDNPLKGFRTNSVDSHPYNSIIRNYLKWNELERNSGDGIDRMLQISNQKWSGIAENNTKVIPRVYLDWDSKTGNEYWPSDMTTGDYYSEQFKRRLEEFVKKLGQAWDNDSRVAWVQMGIIGYWGEHHSPSPSQWQQELLGDLFTEAFKNKKVLVRLPFEHFQNYEFGWYWDSFAHIDQINSNAIPMMEQCPDRWKTVPIEGETAYNWGDYAIQPGSSPNETLRDPGHRDWLISYIRKLHCTGLGWVASYNHNDSVVQAGAELVQKAFGYRYVLKEVTYPGTIQNQQSFSVSFDVMNTGSAPFYYEWPVELRLLDPVTRAVKWKQVFQTVDIREWMPGDDWNQGTRAYDLPAPVVFNSDTFMIENPLPKGKYILALAILDPAGMKPSVKFATTQYFKGGNHPIGYIGIDTVLEQTTLDPAVFDDPLKDNTLSYTVISTYQAPFGGSNHKIPGIIEAEHYDKGGEGLAYHDDGLKQGNTGFRPDDFVDVVANAKASNGFAVGYTEETEWLEYTVDALPGRYNVTLYYFGGETPGELVIHFDEQAIDTIRGLQNSGWDQPDSLITENVIIASGGEEKILRLELINHGGFDIDAIKFTRLYTPVVGVNLTGCPEDTLSSGFTYQLNASTDPPYANDPTISWTSSNEAVATVDENGIITATGEGTTTISVTSSDGGFQDECEIIFTIPLISVYGATIGNCPLNILEAGNTHQLIANVAPPNATNTAVTWSSSNPAVASVDSGGLVTGLSQGTTTIKLTTLDGEYTSTCALGVKGSSTNTASADQRNSSSPDQVSVYPNPAADLLFVRFPESVSGKTVKVFNSLGQLLIDRKTNDSRIQLDVHSFKNQKLLIVEVSFLNQIEYYKVFIADHGQEY